MSHKVFAYLVLCSLWCNYAVSQKVDSCGLNQYCISVELTSTNPQLLHLVGNCLLEAGSIQLRDTAFKRVCENHRLHFTAFVTDEKLFIGVAGPESQMEKSILLLNQLIDQTALDSTRFTKIKEKELKRRKYYENDPDSFLANKINEWTAENKRCLSQPIANSSWSNYTWKDIKSIIKNLNYSAFHLALDNNKPVLSDSLIQCYFEKNNGNYYLFNGLIENKSTFIFQRNTMIYHGCFVWTIDNLRQALTAEILFNLLEKERNAAPNGSKMDLHLEFSAFNSLRIYFKTAATEGVGNDVRNWINENIQALTEDEFDILKAQVIIGLHAQRPTIQSQLLGLQVDSLAQDLVFDLQVFKQEASRMDYFQLGQP